MRSRGLRLLPMCGLVLMFLAGIGGARAGNLQVVLAAGDDAQPVFDNAVAAMAAWLEARGVPAGDIHRLSASPAQAGNWAGLSTLDNLLHSIEDLSVRPGDRCLVFLTSHGERGEGLWLARSQTALHPASLARALAQGCGAAPTVVIVSGCYSGGFARGEMARPNRVIMTAARADRPSFGCQAERTYTFFDQCLLAALPKSASWRAAFSETRRCVGRMERARGERPSEPQSYFGKTASLKMRF